MDRYCDENAVPSKVKQLMQLAHLHSLRLSRSLSLDQWRRLLTSPAFQQVRHIQVIFFFGDDGFTAECVELLGQLPHLSSLSLWALPTSVDLAGLSRSSSLTRLAVSVIDETVLGVAALTPCPPLRELELRSLPDWSGPKLLRLFSQPNMAQQLTRLSFRLGELPVNASPAHWATIVSALTHLHTLDVDHTLGVDRLLPYLALCSSLRLLRLRPQCPGSHRSSAECIVPSAALRSLLVASPQLCVELQLGPQWVFAQYADRQEAEAAWTRSHSEMRALELEFAGRFTVFTDECNIMLPVF